MNYVEIWNQYWFSTSDHYEYGLWRIIIVFGLLYYTLEKWKLMGRAMKTPVEFTWKSPYLKLIPFHFPPNFRLLFISGAILFTMALLGIYTRLSVFSLSIWFIYFFGFASSTGGYAHSASLPGLILLSATFFPGIDNHSVDALLGWTALAPVPQFDWPAKLVLLMFSMVYFSTGVAKVRNGNSFLSGDTLEFMLLGPTGTNFSSDSHVRPDQKWRDGIGLASFVYDVRQQRPLGKFMAQNKTGLAIGSWMTFIWEILFPLSLFSREAMIFFLVTGVLFHLGVYLTMGINFFIYVFLYLLFIDWNFVFSLFR